MKGYITIAFGAAYVEYSILLGKSLKASGNTEPFYVITDTNSRSLIESSYVDGLIKVKHNEEFRNDPFLFKLKLLEYSPFEETLFLDADSLIFGNLDIIWRDISNKNQDFFTYGYEVRDGFAYQMNVQEMMKVFGSTYIIVHNGGLYFFKKTETTKRIFDIAYQVLNILDKSTLNKNPRNKHIYDEFLFAYAMIEIGYTSQNYKLSDNKWTYAPLLRFTSSLEFDLLKPFCKVDYQYNPSDFETGHPLILHYSDNPMYPKKDIYLKALRQIN